MDLETDRTGARAVTAATTPTAPGAHAAHVAPSDAAPAGTRALDVVGAALGGVVERVARLRGSKPMHPKGALLRGVLTRDGSSGGRRAGAEWIDAPGVDEVLVRFSRGGGLPDGWPDVHGLALRTPDGSDLLLSTSGRRVVLRHALTFQRVVGHGTYTSIMPFRTARGPVMVAALPAPARHLPTEPRALAHELAARPWQLDLVWAPFGGAWRPFGTLEVGGPAQDGDLDPPLRFEPLAPPPGLEVYGWVARVREPAYRAARRGYPDGDAPRPGAPPG